MRLRRLDLTRYGKFTDLAIDFGEKAEGPDLHVVYGLNEAGKSTAFSGYLDLLFGIEERSRYGFLHQYAAMEVGAVLEFAGASHEVRRVKQRTGSLRDASGRPVGETALAGALSGLTRDAYRMMFSLDDQTLEDGGNAILDSKGDLGELLFSASAGLAGLSKALGAVAAEADGIFRKRASTTEVAALKHRLKELKGERDKIDTQASVHAGLVADLRGVEREYDEVLRDRGSVKARLDDLGRMMRAAPLVVDHARLGDELAGFEGLPRPPKQWAEEIGTLMIRDAELGATLRGKDEQIERLGAEINGIVVDEAILRLGPHIEALMSAASRHETAEIDLPKRRAALAEARSRLANLAKSATGGTDEADPDALVIDVATLGTMRDLIEEWSGIEARLTTATEEEEAASGVLEQALAERMGLDRADATLGASRKATLQACVARMRGGDLIARRRLAAMAADAKAQAFVAALRSLLPWTGGAERLETLVLPTPERLKAWRDALAGQDARRERHRERHREATSRKACGEAALGAARTVAGAIGDGEADALLEARERAWASHLDRRDADTATDFERAMRAVDVMAEARLASADRLAEMRGLEKDCAVAEAAVLLESRLIEEVDRETATLLTEIEVAWPTDLPTVFADPIGERLARIGSWIAGRDRAIATLGELRIAQAEADAAANELSTEARRLVGALAPDDDGFEVADPAALLQAAETALGNDAARGQAREAADRLVRDSTRALDERRRALARATEAETIWAERWTRALAGTWLSDRASDRGAVKAVVDLVAGLPSKIDERDGFQYRVTAMEKDNAAFLTDLQALYLELGESPTATGAAAATALRDRHRAASDAVALRRRKEGALAGMREERAVLLAEMAVHESRKSEILAFFEARDLQQANAGIERCACRDRVEEQRASLVASILKETGSASMDVVLARLAGEGPTERAATNEELTRRVDDLDLRLQSLFARRSTAADRLAAIGGDDAAARVDAERRTVTLLIEDKALRYLHLRTGALVAERALQIYRDKHRGSMMQRASDAFRSITQDAYAGLSTRPDKDRETLIGLPRSGGSKLAVDMSKGTRFQLYLALRLAGYEEFASGRQAVPFVADDIMETFDEPRSEEVFTLFGKMSEVGQVIYLTHHRHICELARKVVPRTKVHVLPS